MKRKPNNSQREDGFSLVETLAAMAILSIAAIPLVQISGDATRYASHLEDRLLSRTVAENVMARTLADPLPARVGVSTGVETQRGVKANWTLLAGPDQPGTLQSLEVTVSMDGSETAQARLVALKAVPLPVEPQLDEDGLATEAVSDDEESDLESEPVEAEE